MKLQLEAMASKAAAKAMIVLALISPASAQTRRIVVSIPDHKLALVENGSVKRIYRVATGKNTTPSPTGRFHIANRVTNPTYYHEGKVVDSGPSNPVGTRWIGLNEKGYGIHGTNAPGSIGKSASHGCIRMARKDLEEFFDLVRPGDEVEILDERDSETASLFNPPPAVHDDKPAAPPVTMAANQGAKADSPNGGQ